MDTSSSASPPADPPHPPTTRVLLVRHAVTGQTGKLLYGRMPGIDLSEEGRAQAKALAERLGALPIRAIYASPVERAAQTAAVLAERLGLEIRRHDGVIEADAGEWTGRAFTDLAPLEEWKALQRRPSRGTLPGGETLAGMQARAVAALEEIVTSHRGEVVVVVSHRDPILAALAHFAGMHLDHYERMTVAPASVSAIEFSGPYATVTKVNDTGSLGDLAPLTHGEGSDD